MAISSDARTPFVSGGKRYAPFGLDMYLYDYEHHLNTKHIVAIASKGDVGTVYRSCNVLNRDKAPSAKVRCWSH